MREGFISTLSPNPSPKGGDKKSKPHPLGRGSNDKSVVPHPHFYEIKDFQNCSLSAIRIRFPERGINFAPHPHFRHLIRRRREYIKHEILLHNLNFINLIKHAGGKLELIRVSTHKKLLCSDFCLRIQ